MSHYDMYPSDTSTVVIYDTKTKAEICRVSDCGADQEELWQRAKRIIEALQLRDDMDDRARRISNPEQHIVTYGNGDAAWLVMYRNNDLFPWVVVEQCGQDSYRIVAGFTSQEQARRYALRGYLDNMSD